jgi:hypothetical protein
VRREWEPEELIASWTLIEPDWELIGGKPGVTRLGFAALLKFFEIEGRFGVQRVLERDPASVAIFAGHRTYWPEL